MTIKRLDHRRLAHGEDWMGTCAAFTCPGCGKVFIAGGVRPGVHKRACPACGKSIARVSGAKDLGGTASIEYEGAASARKSAPNVVARDLG